MFLIFLADFVKDDFLQSVKVQQNTRLAMCPELLLQN